MKSIQIYDKPLCCATGVCGPDVDPVLPRFAADVEWLKAQGHAVERFNLAQQPAAFAQASNVQQLLQTQGTACLPIVVIDGQVVSTGIYLTREQLTQATQDKCEKTTSNDLAVLPQATSCCTDTNCC